MSAHVEQLLLSLCLWLFSRRPVVEFYSLPLHALGHGTSGGLRLRERRVCTSWPGGSAPAVSSSFSPSLCIYLYGYGFFFVRLYCFGLGCHANSVEEYVLLSALLHIFAGLKRTRDQELSSGLMSCQLSLAVSFSFVEEHVLLSALQHIFAGLKRTRDQKLSSGLSSLLFKLKTSG